MGLVSFPHIHQFFLLLFSWKLERHCFFSELEKIVESNKVNNRWWAYLMELVRSPLILGVNCCMNAKRFVAVTRDPPGQTVVFAVVSQGHGFSWHGNVIFILTEITFRRLHGVWGAGPSPIKVDHKVQLPRITFAMCEEHHQTGNIRCLRLPSVVVNRASWRAGFGKPVGADYF